MLARFTQRMLTEVDPRLLLKFAWGFGRNGGRAFAQFQRRVKRGEYFPAFLFISVTNRCNLSCLGCWVSPTTPPRDLPLPVVHNLIEESRKHGSAVIGILGGEPLLYDGLMDLFRRHRDCYFLLFSNGTLLTEEVAKELRRAGNVSPLISVEGLERTSDERRGEAEVYRRTVAGLEACARQRLVTGVATSLCRSNFDDLASEPFVRELIRRRVHYLWYYIYRPVGPNPSPELALSAEQVLALRRFLVDIRPRVPILVVDAYWDHEGRALCPAVAGISHHISPAGDIEPCPPIQFAKENVGDGRDLYERITRSDFLREFREMAGGATRGCVLMEAPERLEAFLRERGAADSSGRGTALDELARMTCRCSHHLPGQEIPERHWLYRLGKKRWFFGLGAYG